MTIDQGVLDGTTEVVIPCEEVFYRSADGDRKRGLIFKNFLTANLSDGSQIVIPSPLTSLEIHDPNGHGLVVFRVEAVARDQGDGNVVHDDQSTP